MRTIWKALQVTLYVIGFPLLFCGEWIVDCADRCRPDARAS